MIDMEKRVSCPACGTYSITATGCDNGECEYRCDECGEYFVADKMDDETLEGKDD